MVFHLIPKSQHVGLGVESGTKKRSGHLCMPNILVMVAACSRLRILKQLPEAYISTAS